MLSYLLYATLSGHGLPAVKFEPFTETPPNIEFKVTRIPNGYHIQSSEGTNIYQSWKPVIEESWRKSIYGDYWVRSIRKTRSSDELDSLTIGEFVWYRNRLWNFAPGETFMFRRIMGVSRLGQLIENRFWVEPGGFSQDVFLHDKPNRGDEAARVIPGATAYPVTDLGDVIARRFESETDESVTLDITEGEFEICRNDRFQSSSGGTHLFQLPERYDDEDYVPPYYYWHSRDLSRNQPKMLITPGTLSLAQTPNDNVFFIGKRGCFAGAPLYSQQLVLNGTVFELADIAAQAGLDSSLEFKSFKDGKLVISGFNGLCDVEAKQIVGYLSIEGVTPGFHTRK